MHHGPRRRHEIRLADVMPFFLLHHDTADKLLELFIARPAPHLRMQVVIPHGKKTSANLSIAGDADAAAMPAKRMRYRRDDPNLADTILEAITPRRLRSRMRNLHQWPV